MKSMEPKTTQMQETCSVKMQVPTSCLQGVRGRCERHGNSYFVSSLNIQLIHYCIARRIPTFLANLQLLRRLGFFSYKMQL